VSMRPDLVNADEIVPPWAGGDEEHVAAEREDAEMTIRRLANQHGHARLPCRGGGFLEVCPDPLAHARDVKAMGDVLRACFDGYNLARAAGPPAGCKATVTSYTRP
jgi:hypothetical protein